MAQVDWAVTREIARTVLETGFDAPVTVGHCCSLSVQDEAEVLQTLYGLYCEPAILRSRERVPAEADA